MLAFPADVLDPLDQGEINLFEAEQLARLTPQKLSGSATEARRQRTELLASHLQARLSWERLRRRVNETLGARREEWATADEAAPALPEDLEDFDPYDTTHLFWEEIKQLGFAFREIKREDVTEEEVAELQRACEPVWTILLRIRRRKVQQNLRKIKI